MLFIVIKFTTLSTLFNTIDQIVQTHVGRVRINNITHLLQLIKGQSLNVFLRCITFVVGVNYFKNLQGDIKKRDVKLKKLSK